MTRARTIHRFSFTQASAVLLMLGLVILPASRAGAQTENTPKDPAVTSWLGVVTEDGIAIRSGRAPEFYSIGTLDAGDFVSVRAANQHADWYTIDVPDGMTGFVSARNIEISPSGKQGTTVGRTRVLYPREDNPALSWRGHPLHAGTTLALLELISTETKGDFYRVEMPEAVGAYVVANFVRKATPTELAAWTRDQVEDVIEEPVEEPIADVVDVINEPQDIVDVARGVVDENIESVSDAIDGVIETEPVDIVTTPEVVDPATIVETVEEAASVPDVVENTPTVEENESIEAPPLPTVTEEPAPVNVPVDVVRPSDENASRIWTAESPDTEFETPTTMDPAEFGAEPTIESSPTSNETTPGVTEVFIDATIIPANQEQTQPVNTGRRKPFRPEQSSPEAIEIKPQAVDVLTHELTPPPTEESLPAAVRAHRDEPDVTFDPAEPLSVAALNDAYASMLRQPVLEREIEPLLREFESRQAQGDLNVHEERLVRSRVMLLELQLERQAFRRKVDARIADAQSSVETLANLENEIADSSRSRFQGVLRMSAVYDGKRLPRLYRLVDPMRRGSIIYVQPADDLNLAAFVDQPVTMAGAQEELEGFAIRVLVPTSVEPR